MAASVISDCDYWVRIGISIEICLTEGLLNVLHNYDNDPSYTGLPDDETDLYVKMVAFKKKSQRKLKHVIREDQWLILCPISGKSNSSDWDITLLVAVIRNATDLPPPAGGWDQKIPNMHDISRAAFCLLARQVRNDVKHGTMKSVSTLMQYTAFRKRIEYILIGLCYKNMVLFEDLESGSLKLYTNQMVKILEDQILNLEESKLDKVVLSNELTQFKQALNNIGVLVQGHVRSEKNQDESIGNLITRVSALESSSIGEVFDDTVLFEVLEIVSKMIGNDWFKLAAGLKITTRKRKLEDDENSNDIDMMNCFEKGEYNISWFQLKNELMQLKRKDILEQLEKETNLTKVLDAVINEHKQNMRDQFVDQQVPQPFIKGSGINFKTMKRNDAYLPLVMVNNKDIEAEWSFSDRNYHLQQILQKKEGFNIEDILTSSDEFVIVDGIAGIGKSTLMDMIILGWAQGDLLNGKNGSPNIKLLLPIKCRELNTISINTEASQMDMLSRLFPDIFKNVSEKQLELISKNILILIDGIDELRYAERIIEVSNPAINDHPPIIQFIHDLLDPSQFLRGKKVLVAGRHGICSNVYSYYGRRVAIRRISVCGFDQSSIRKYVVSFGDSDILINTILQKINESATLKALASIPVYLWVLCGLYSENTITSINSTTELLLYSCLVFIRSHLKESGHSLSDQNLSLKDISCLNDVVSYMMTIARVSYETLKDRKVVFEEIDFEGLQDIEKTGFFVKSRNSESGYVYQFRHLVLQELFCALYVLFCPDKNDRIQLYEDISIQSCLFLVAGLEGIISNDETNESSVLNVFLKHCAHDRYEFLTKCSPYMDYLTMDLINNKRFSADAKKQQFMLPMKFFPAVKKQPRKEIIFPFVDTEEEFVKSFFERQQDCGKFLKNYVNGMQLIVSFNSYTPQRWQHVLFFIEKLMKCNCSNLINLVIHSRTCSLDLTLPLLNSISVNPKDEIITENGVINMERLFRLYCDSENIYFKKFGFESENNFKDITTLKKILPYCEEIAFNWGLENFGMMSGVIQNYVDLNGSCLLKSLVLRYFVVDNASFAHLFPMLKCVESLEVSCYSGCEQLRGSPVNLAMEIERLAEIKQLKLKHLHLGDLFINDNIFYDMLECFRHLETVIINDGITNDSYANVVEKIYIWSNKGSQITLNKITLQCDGLSLSCPVIVNGVCILSDLDDNLPYH